MHCKDQYARKHAVKVESLGLMHQPSYMMFSNFKSSAAAEIVAVCGSNERFERLVATHGHESSLILTEDQMKTLREP